MSVSRCRPVPEPGPFFGAAVASRVCVSIALAACSGESERPGLAPSGQAAPTTPSVPSFPLWSRLFVRCRISHPWWRKYGPAVVNVESRGESSAGGRGRRVVTNDPFYDFFRRIRQSRHPDQGPRGNSPPGSGRWFGLYRQCGRLHLTNTHVVGNGRRGDHSRLTDRREFRPRSLAPMSAPTWPSSRCNAPTCRPSSW